MVTDDAICPMCGGQKKEGRTLYCVDLAFGVVVVRSVPATICSQCGEEWIGAEIAGKLEEIVEAARKTQSQVEMLDFSAAA